MTEIETYRALSIAPTQVENAAPVLFELIGDSTEIGSADDNAIVLANPNVALHHLEVRRVDGRDHLLINLSERRRARDLTWFKYRRGDAYWCPRHGSIARLDARGWCAKCRTRRGSLWLMRPLTPGDAFDVGRAFRATYLVPERANQTKLPPRQVPPRDAFDRPRKIAIPTTAPQIATQDLPTDDSNLWRWQPAEAPFPIFLHQRVNVDVTRHARQNRDREVGGVLIGEVCRDQDGHLFVVASHAIKAEFAQESRGQLTFTHNTWLKIHHTLEAQFPGKLIVGWYHTHPGWSIFLSDWDLFIHQNFFKQPWQVALVIDPSLDRAGFFVWKDNQVCNPQAPVEPFRLAEVEWSDIARPRVRIKLTDPHGASKVK
ncbi:MAG: Mov34/MPN/PAD-1 family protein [Chloroflexi bacterium]|nr:Mov34/MPN/PAD-1 family protein [Chloroflexota bacterium]